MSIHPAYNYSEVRINPGVNESVLRASQEAKGKKRHWLPHPKTVITTMMIVSLWKSDDVDFDFDIDDKNTGTKTRDRPKIDENRFFLH